MNTEKNQIVSSKAKGSCHSMDDWIVSMPRGMWLAVDSKQLESLGINVVGPAKSLTAKEWGTSSVLKSHGLVAMVSAELPGKWPASWYLTGEPTKNLPRFCCEHGHVGRVPPRCKRGDVMSLLSFLGARVGVGRSDMRPSPD